MAKVWNFLVSYTILGDWWKLYVLFKWSSLNKRKSRMIQETFQGIYSRPTLDSKGRINNASIYLNLMNGSNKIECVTKAGKTCHE